VKKVIVPVKKLKVFSFSFKLSRVGVTITGLGFVIGFVEHKQLVTTNKDYVLTVLHTFALKSSELAVFAPVLW
jgi:hypothetical protein